MDERATMDCVAMDCVALDCVARARALTPLIAAAGSRIEANRELPPDLVDALHEARLFRMLLPRSLGGDEVSPVAFVHAIEELAKADASTAWVIAQTSVCSTISKCLKRETAEEIFRNDPRGVLAWGPSAMKSKAIAEKDGYRVTGAWPFASGSRHATWLCAHCQVYEPDGRLRHDANGKPVEKTLVIPRGRAAISDVWHVIGLKGTGSDTYAFSDVFVPENRAIALHALDPAERREPGALYSFTIHQLFGATFPAVALGIARATLDAFIALAKTKIPVAGTAVLRENAVVQSQVGVAATQLAAARAFFFQTWEETWHAMQSGALTADQRVTLRMAALHAAQEARKVVETAYLAAGATAIFADNPFERRFRDMHAVSQQLQAHFAIFELIGRHFLDLPVNSRLI